MDIKELNSFKLSDAVKFHDKLNPKLWMGSRLDPAVKKQLLLIAKDFITELGIKDLDVEDVTISGSNAAYTYTPHSDLDLHILVDMDKLPADEVYRELFQAKKTLYNDTHDISVHGVPVELYVQDTNQPVVSLGEYSLLNDKWIKFPTKRRANLDQNATKAKYERLKELVELALQTRDIDRVSKALALIKRYRKAGLDTGGEFGPENLAYKVIRKQGGIQKLYDLRNKLHSEELTIENMYTGPKMKFLRPGELKGSYTDYDLLRMGFKKAQNGSWYIPQFKWEKLRAANLIGEETLEEKFAKEFEDYHPNAKPRGPEFKPTMPKGTVRVDVSDVYDWYKLGQHISNLKGLGKHDFGKGPPSTILSFGDEDTEHKYIQDLEKTGLTTTDIDPIDPNQPKGMKRQKVDPTFNVNEESGKKSAIYSTDVYGMTAYHSKCLEPGCDWESKRYDSIKLAQNAAQKHAQKHFKKGVAEEISESRGSLFSWLKQQFPTWPDYVVKDFLYQQAKTITSQEQLADFLEIQKKDFGQVKWRLEKLPITLDIFTPKTQQMIKSREGGSSNPFKVPKDAERHAQQLKMIQQHGVRTEPIIVAKLNNGYDLIEGWHRTIQHLKAFPEGYTGPAWVGYGATYTSEIAEQGVSEASGYIPSEKEKNDPRFKSALTVDVKPDSIKKNAKAFSWLTSRAGIPPDARPDGKIK